MKQGIISSFNRTRGIGTILVDAAICERYFFYDNKIVEGPQPTIGDKVLFHVSNKKPRPGQLPFAENITILPRPTKAAVFTDSVLAIVKAGGADEVSS